MRYHANCSLVLPQASWHCSDCFATIAQVQRKIKAFCHSDKNRWARSCAGQEVLKGTACSLLSGAVSVTLCHRLRRRASSALLSWSLHDEVSVFQQGNRGHELPTPDTEDPTILSIAASQSTSAETTQVPIQ